ncbi:MAG TPA: hypothetical protein PLY96_11730 [Chromatiaceae bacterium]|jgi:hypothetical protein|nr:hypothetical protein [Chromatiaceae bacterium]
MVVTNDAPQGRSRAFPPPLSAHAFDTTPGARSALAPPPGFDGGQDQYVEVIRRRYRQDHEARQCILLAALRANQAFGWSALSFSGPYARWAEHLIQTTAERLKRKPKEA